MNPISSTGSFRPASLATTAHAEQAREAESGVPDQDDSGSGPIRTDSIDSSGPSLAELSAQAEAYWRPRVNESLTRNQPGHGELSTSFDGARAYAPVEEARSRGGVTISVPGANQFVGKPVHLNNGVILDLEIDQGGQMTIQAGDGPDEKPEPAPAPRPTASNGSSLASDGSQGDGAGSDFSSSDGDPDAGYASTF